jgi:hypothetical protein
MNQKQLAILIALGVVLGGAGLLVRSRHASSFNDSTAQMGGSVLGAFDVNAVASVRIVSGSNIVNIVKTGDNWVVKERGNYPANFGNVADFVRKLADLKITKPVTVGPSRLPMLELVAPDKGPGVLVEFGGADGKPIKSILLGLKYMKEGNDNSPMGGGGFPIGRYIMVDNKIESVALVSDALSNAEAKPEDWIDKEFVKVEQPISVSVAKPESTNSFALSRTNEFGEWNLADAKPEEKLDTSKVSGFNTVLSSPSFNDVLLTPPADAFEKPVQAVVQTAGGFTYDVKIGKAGADDVYPIQVAVAAELQKERVAAADEKKEDKDRLDKEFKDKLAKQQEKLKKEQAYAKWTYSISKWSIDSLLKNRSELLADKKADEKKPDEKPAATPGLPTDILPVLPK